MASRISWAIRASAATRPGSMSSGSEVMSAAVKSWSTRVEVAPSASHGKTLPARTTNARDGGEQRRRRDAVGGRAQVETDRERQRAHDHGREDEGAPRAEADQADHAGHERAGAGGRERVGEPLRGAGGEHHAGDRGIAGTQPSHADARLGLALGPGEHDRAGAQHQRDQRGGHRGQVGAALHQQGRGTEGEEQARRHERRTASGGGAPRLEVVLDDVGHRLDHVVVDARGGIVDARGDGEQPAVLDALEGEAGVEREPPAVGRADAVAAVHRGRVEQPDAASQLGEQLGDRDGAGKDEVHAPGPGRDGHPHQPGGDRADRSRRLCHLLNPSREPGSASYENST
jgi:hypothetical protein